MKVAIIGSGVVGLSLANELIASHGDIYVDIIDSFSIPSKGTSIRNSGVLHAGLYYQPGSLKSKLCFEGRTLLEDYTRKNNLQLLQCGKLLVPHSEGDITRLHAIKQKADLNGCNTELLTYKEAASIQPGLCSRDVYLWSPKTCVFSPPDILNQLVADLVASQRASFIRSTVHSIDPGNTSLRGSNLAGSIYDFIYNVSGPGALKLFKPLSSSLDHLFLIPFIGEYARLNSGPDIKTNIYPVPDPELPFLGVHVTPQLRGKYPIIGPNALPFPRSYLDEHISDDMTDFPSRLLILLGFYASNSANFREHANSEFSFSKKQKFLRQAQSFFEQPCSSSIEVAMDKSIYGIRPQLVDLRNLLFVNDFICKPIGKTFHVVNAVSPAFTSSLALAKYLASHLV